MTVRQGSEAAITLTIIAGVSLIALAMSHDPTIAWVIAYLSGGALISLGVRIVIRSGRDV
jgi:hypothetical protein